MTDIVPASTSGVDLATWLNGVKSNLITFHSGANRPTYAVNGTIWLKTGGSVYSLMYYDGSQDSTLLSIDITRDKPRLVVDADNDSYIQSAAGDDIVEFILGGTTRMDVSRTGLEIRNTTTSNPELRVKGVRGIEVPLGGSSQRPTNKAGIFRYNTSLGEMEFGTGTEWKTLLSSVGAGITAISQASDTNITSPGDGSLLFYDTSTSKWRDYAVSGDLRITDTGLATIGTGTVTSGKLANNSVITAKIANRAVTGSKIALATIDIRNLAGISATGTAGQYIVSDGNGGFTLTTPTLRLGPGAITKTQLAEDSVDPSKLDIEGTANSGNRIVMWKSDTKFEYDQITNADITNNTIQPTKLNISGLAGQGFVLGYGDAATFLVQRSGHPVPLGSTTLKATYRAIAFNVSNLLNMNLLRLTLEKVVIPTGVSRLAVTLNPAAVVNTGKTNESSTVHSSVSNSSTGRGGWDTLKGWIIDIADANREISGVMTMVNQGNNNWVMDYQFALLRTSASVSPFNTEGAGYAELSSPIQRVVVQATTEDTNTLVNFAAGGVITLEGE